MYRVCPTPAFSSMQSDNEDFCNQMMNVLSSRFKCQNTMEFRQFLENLADKQLAIPSFPSPDNH